MQFCAGLKNSLINFKGSCNITDVTFICKYDSDKEMTMEDFMNPDAFDDDMINRMYKNENFLNAAKLWLPFMLKRGFLDPMEGEGEEIKDNGEEK